MAVKLGNDFIETLKNRVSLYDIVSESVDLKHSGSGYVGLSPFQSEKTPSFYLYDDNQKFKCFSSGKSGDVITYIIETKGLSFIESVKFLANRAGLKLPNLTNKDEELHKKNNIKKTRLLKLNQIVSRTFEHILQQKNYSTVAKSYLKHREINQEAIDTFKIGYSSSKVNLLSFLKESDSLKSELDFENLEDDLKELGLIKKSFKSAEIDTSIANEEYYEFFRSRIIFPIQRSDGTVIAFGGRSIEKNPKTAKYLNSPESLIYNKSSTLYGLFQAKESIRNSNQAIFVEGYLDVISLWQLGITNSVACCGTALTGDHIKIISRFAKSAVLIFDGDLAGIKAAVRSFELFINTPVSPLVCMLPRGEDPDTLSKKLKKEEFEDYVKQNQKPLFLLLLDYLLAEAEPGLLEKIETLTPQNLSNIQPTIYGIAANRAVNIIRKVSNAVEREHYLKLISERYNVSYDSILKLFSKENDNKQMINSSEISTPINISSNERTQAIRGQNSRYQYSKNFTSPYSTKNDNTNSFQHSNYRKNLVKNNSEDLKIKFYQQIIISALVETNLIEHYINSTELQKDEQHSSSYEIKNELFSILNRIKGKGFTGIDKHKNEKNKDYQVEILNQIKHIFENSNLKFFNLNELCQEAFRQIKFGGIDPKMLVSHSKKAEERIDFKEKSTNLSAMIKKETNEDEQIRLAQEKLLLKRRADNSKSN